MAKRLAEWLADAGEFEETEHPRGHGGQWVEKGWSAEQAALVNKARAFATQSHAAVKQLRKYTGEPYIVHPAAVVHILKTVPHTPDMVAAAWLHDVVEDTGVPAARVRDEFGDKVADLVGWLTDVSKPSDGNRAARKAIDRAHSAQAPAEAQTIKVADLIQNTETIGQHDPKFYKVYKAEKIALLNVLTKADPTLLKQAWDQIDPKPPELQLLPRQGQLPFAETPGQKYLRFGRIPKGEVSTVGQAPNWMAQALGESYAGQKLAGVSVLPVTYNKDRNLWQIDDDQITSGGMATIDSLLADQATYDDHFVSGGHHDDPVTGEHTWSPPVYEWRKTDPADIRPIYLVEGDDVGEGTDGEPLLKRVRILDQVQIRDVLHQGYFDPAQDLAANRNPELFGVSHEQALAREQLIREWRDRDYERLKARLASEGAAERDRLVSRWTAPPKLQPLTRLPDELTDGPMKSQSAIVSRPPQVYTGYMQPHVEVLINPSEREVKSFGSETEHQELRTLIDAHNNIFVWKGAEALHGAMLGALVAQGAGFDMTSPVTAGHSWYVGKTIAPLLRKYLTAGRAVARQVHDAIDAKPRRRDPTRTVTLRRGFRAEGELLLRQFRANLRRAIVDYNVLGLAGAEIPGFQSPADRLRTFANWLETAAYATLDAKWWVTAWLNKALASGLARAKREVAIDDPFPALTSDTFASLHQLAAQEVKGIIAALVQQVGRHAHAAQVRGRKATVAYHAMTKPLDKAISPRLAAFANSLTVKAHNTAKIAVYRHKGVGMVGIAPELRNPAHRRHDHLVRDQDEDDDQLVGWLTAGDDLVCQACEDAAEDSPYTLDEAQDLIPLHPNCRCSVYPWEDRRFAGDAAWEEELHPREHGRFAFKGVVTNPSKRDVAAMVMRAHYGLRYLHNTKTGNTHVAEAFTHSHLDIAKEAGETEFRRDWEGEPEHYHWRQFRAGMIYPDERILKAIRTHPQGLKGWIEDIHRGSELVPDPDDPSWDQPQPVAKVARSPAAERAAIRVAHERPGSGKPLMQLWREQQALHGQQNLAVEAEYAARLETEAKRLAAQMHFAPARVTVRMEQGTFKLNGQDLPYAGAFDPMFGTVRLYSHQMDPDFLRAGLAHEIGHAKFDAYWTQVHKEQDQLLAEHGGDQEALYREPISDKYPLHKESVELFLKPMAQLKNEDGVTPYSKMYHESYQSGAAGPHKANWYMCLNETIAEMARLDAKGKLDRPQLLALKPHWRAAYDAIKRYWEKAKPPGFYHDA